MQKENNQLSQIQRTLWLEQQLSPGSSILSISGYLTIKGELNSGIFHKSLSHVIKTNDVFNIVFYEEEDEPKIKYERKKSRRLLQIDLSKSSNPMRDCLTYMTEDKTVPFDIMGTQLYRTCLFRITKKKYIWYFAMHHILMDSWGVSQFVKQVANAYSILIKKEKLKKYNQVSYANFISDEITYGSSGKYAEDKTYWEKRFDYVAAPIFVQKAKENKSIRVTKNIDQMTYLKMHNISTDLNCSIFHFLMCLIGSYFCKRYQVSETLLSYNVLNRRNSNFKKMPGLCFNTLPLNYSVNVSATLSEVLVDIKTQLLQDYRHQRYPSSKIFSSDRSLGRELIVLSYEKPDFTVYFGEISTEIQMLPTTLARNPLSVFFREYHQDQDLVIDFDFDSRYFNDQERSQIPKQITSLIDVFASSPETPIGQVSILSEAERNQLLYEFNAGYQYRDNEITLVDLFEEQAMRTSDRWALVISGNKYSYEELNNRSNNIAHVLRDRGVGIDTVVAIMMDYSMDMMASVIAVLKAGGTYLPLDTKYPEKRVNQMLEQSRCEYMLTDREYSVNDNYLVRDKITVSDIPSDRIHNPDHINLPEHLAYIIFTSGSTGIPKGVMMQHKSVINVLDVWREKYELDTVPITLLQVSSFAHDVFTGNWIKSLLTGGCLILSNAQERQNYSKMIALCIDHGVTMFDTTPSLTLPLLEHAEAEKRVLTNLKTIVVGSDICSLEDYRKMVRDYGKQVNIFNSYGVTEACIYSSHYKQSVENIPLKGNLSIGAPFKNTKYFLLDDQMQLVSIGVQGELYIGGDSLSCGYINQEELTNERFIPNPFSEGELLYKTGDLVKWQANGCIEFICRKDFQIKLRGYRIEPGEIEHVFCTHPGISKCIVIGDMLRPDKVQLVAYYESSADINVDDLRDYLRDCLPEYMVPAVIRRIEYMPLNASGKINRMELSRLASEKETIKSMILPQNDIQEQLLSVWKEVLDKKTISIDDDFFELGGDSLDAIKIATLLESFEIQIQATDLFFNRSIESLAKRISKVQVLEYKINNFKDAERYLFKNHQIEGRFLTHTDNTIGEKYIVLFVKDMKRLDKKSIMDALLKTCSERVYPHYIVPMSEKDKITAVNIPEENRVHKKIINSLIKQEQQFFGAIKNCKNRKRMEINGIQQNVLDLYPKKLFGSIIRYPQNLDLDKLNIAAKRMISAQTMLRSILHKGGNTYYWKVFDGIRDIQIPFIDLSEYSIPLKRRFLEDVLPDHFLKYSRQKDFLYRLVLVKENIKNFYLVTVADHLICDDFSKEALGYLLQELYEKKESTLEIVPYETYTKQVLSGPLNIDEDDIVSEFMLDQFVLASDSFQRSMTKYTSKFNEAANFNVFLKHAYDKTKKWEISISVLVRLCQDILGISKIPLMILYNGRSYKDDHYFNTIGNFNDYIPVFIDLDQLELDALPEYVYQKIRLAVNHQINFTSLVNNRDLAKKYKKLTRITQKLMPNEKRGVPAVFFDYKMKSTLEDINLSMDSNLYEEWQMSGWFFTIKFTSDQYLSIGMNVPADMNKTKLKATISETVNSILKEQFPVLNKHEDELRDVGRKEYYPLSSIQKSVYVEQEKAPEQTHYQMIGEATIYGNLDVYRLRNALKTIVQYQDILRTGFRFYDNELVQIVQNEVELNLEQYEPDDYEDIYRPFNLEEAPLFRVGFFKLESGRFVLLINIHHIIADQLSMQIIMDNVVALYQGMSLSPLKIQYRDYAVWQQSQFGSPGIKSQEEYWLKELAAGLPRMNFPLDKTRPDRPSYKGCAIQFSADPLLSADIISLSKQKKITPFIIMATGLSIWIKACCGQNEIMFAVPMSSRRDARTQGLIGPFINTVLIKLTVEDIDTDSIILNKVRYKIKKAYENVDYPIEEAVKKVNYSMDMGRKTFFDILLSQEMEQDQEYRMDDLLVNIKSKVQNNTSKTDIALYFSVDGSFSLEYNSDIFEENTALQLGKQYKQTIVSLVKSSLTKDNPVLKHD